MSILVLILSSASRLTSPQLTAGQATLLDLPAEAVLEIALIDLILDGARAIDDGDNVKLGDEQVFDRQRRHNRIPEKQSNMPKR
jgi:hypothetical protein